jgi:hypothetical protein
VVVEGSRRSPLAETVPCRAVDTFDVRLLGEEEQEGDAAEKSAEEAQLVRGPDLKEEPRCVSPARR